jgi:hypothetical protein
LLDQSR